MGCKSPACAWHQACCMPVNETNLGMANACVGCYTQINARAMWLSDSMQERLVRTQLLTLAYSDNSVKTYTNQIRQFMAFCEKLQLPPQSDASAACWILHASEVLHLKKATVSAKLAAYKWAHASLWGLGPARTEVGSTLYLTQRAIARRAEDKEPKLAVGRDGLKRILTSRGGGKSDSDVLELYAWWALAYAAFLRCSEVAVLSWEDVGFVTEEDGMAAVTMQLAVSGRQIFKNHSESISFHIRARPGAVCAVALLKRWCRLCGRPATGKIFHRSVEDVRRVFQSRASSVLGGSPSQYGLHSLRAGAATDADGDGVALSTIKFRGRWKSATVLQYMRAGEQMAAELGLPRAGGRAVRVL